MHDTAKASLVGRHPRSVEQADIYRERHCESLFFRHHIWLDGLGCIRLGNAIITT